MKTVLELLLKHYLYLFTDFNFKIVDSKHHNISSGYIILQSSNLRMRMIGEYGKGFMELAPVDDPNLWYDITFVKKLITNYSGEINYIDPGDQAEFIRHHYNEIVVRFHETKLEVTKSELEKIKQHRS